MGRSLKFIRPIFTIGMFGISAGLHIGKYRLVRTFYWRRRHFLL